MPPATTKPTICSPTRRLRPEPAIPVPQLVDQIAPGQREAFIGTINSVGSVVALVANTLSTVLGSLLTSGVVMAAGGNYGLVFPVCIVVALIAAFLIMQIRGIK